MRDQVKTTSHLLVTLLGSGDHLAAGVGTPGDGEPLAGRVLDKLTRGLLHIAGGAAGLVILPALLRAALWLGAAPDQRVVAVQQTVVLSHLFVGDAAPLLVGLVTDLLLGGQELGGVGEVTLLHRLVDTGQLRVLPATSQLGAQLRPGYKTSLEFLSEGLLLNTVLHAPVLQSSWDRSAVNSFSLNYQTTEETR